MEHEHKRVNNYNDGVLWVGSKESIKLTTEEQKVKPQVQARYKVVIKFSKIWFWEHSKF